MVFLAYKLMHEHNKCEHKNLKYCEKCDVVYCEDCKKEWRYDFSTITYAEWPSTDTTNAPHFYTWL